MEYTHLTILIAYMAAMVAIGIYFSRASVVATGDDFMFAGRRLPRIVLVGTLLATWVGSGTIIGGANFAYQYGPLAFWLFFGSGTPVAIVVLYFLAARIRRASRYTIPELLEVRFGLGTRLVAAAAILLAYVGITSYQFTGGGYVLSLVTPLTETQGTLLVAALVILVAIGGGLLSVAYSDFLSAIVIVGGLLLAVPIVIFGALGGFGDYVSQLPGETASVTGGLSPLQMLGFFLPLFLLLLGDQNMYQRITAAKDEQTASSSMVGFFLGTFLVVIPVGLLASAAAILLPQLAENPDTAVLSLAAEGYLPAVLGGLLLAGGLAFIITTGSSFILSCAGNLLYDFYVRFARHEVSETRRLWLHRGAVALLALVALAMGTLFPTVLALQIHSYTIYGVAVTPVVLAALLWRRINTAGALSSIIVATTAVLVWEFADWAGKPELNSVIIALPLALLAMVGVSLLTPRPVQPAGAEEETELRAEPE